MDIALLRSSFGLLQPSADALARRFYARLFATYPQVRPLFKTQDFTEQRRKLMASVAAVVALVDRPETLGPVLATMGRQHQELGVLPRHYEYVAGSMLAAMADEAGAAWTPEIAHTWDEALHIVAERMIAAGAGAPAPAPAPAPAGAPG
ncbi:MAG TPA: globin domain-containing protein [Planctomycetota bacterium]|nr:globin domain-containing protein [Planctomycetota bacterium]